MMKNFSKPCLIVSWFLLRLHAECFPAGVHWLSIGQVDKPDLLVKVQSLCFRLEQSLDEKSVHLNSLDEAKERLRFLMLRKYPRLANLIFPFCFVPL